MVPYEEIDLIEVVVVRPHGRTENGGAVLGSLEGCCRGGRTAEAGEGVLFGWIRVAGSQSVLTFQRHVVSVTNSIHVGG